MPQFDERRFEPRGKPVVLDEELLEKIAAAAAEKAVEMLEAKMYQGIGKAFVNKLLLVVGSGVAGIWVYGKTKGWWS